MTNEEIDREVAQIVEYMQARGKEYATAFRAEIAPFAARIIALEKMRTASPTAVTPPPTSLLKPVLNPFYN